MTPHTIPQTVLFPDLFDKPLVATFNQEHASSDGGAVLLKAAERVYGLVKAFARCLADKRAPGKIRHTLADLIGQRVFGIACGHPDGNDADHLADDPIHKLLLGRDPVSGAPLASQPTISRFENGARRTVLYRMGRELAACVIERRRRRLHGRARRITIDLDHFTSEAPPQTDEACRPRRLLTLEVDSDRCSSRGVKPPSWSPGGDGGRKLAGEEPIDRSPTMKVARSVAEALAEHTTLTLECIDRMYLNVYVPLLQRAAGAAYFFRKMRGAAVPSSALMAPMTRRFVDAIKSFAARNRIEIVTFRRGERKDDRTRQYLRRWSGGEGVLYIGKAQEKAKVVRTERRHDPATGDTYPWLAASTAMVNQFYFYAVDDDFGPFFLKFCSYFPYNAKLCINGHEYLKRQLTKRGIAYESLDNGILRCSDPERLQRLADGLTAAKVDALLRKWLARLPHPFAASDRQQGIRYDVSILQAESL